MIPHRVFEILICMGNVNDFPILTTLNLSMLHYFIFEIKKHLLFLSTND